MTRVLVVSVACTLGLSGLYGQSQDATPSPQGSDTFPQVHAPLFEPAQSNDAGALTEQLARKRPAELTVSEPTARSNFIDDFIFGKMERDGIPHAPPATDLEFLRRVTLDLTGRIPSRSEIRAFVADKDPAKREKLIGRLVSSEAFVDKWAYFFMDLFRANGKMGRGQRLFHYWMKENLRADRPYDEVVRAIIAASAKSNHVVAASNVIAREHIQGKAQPDDGEDLGMVHQLDTNDELAIIYGKAFLGINLSCISCHDGTGHLEKVNSG